ncbi:MAG: DEAD/DEAH box helicase [Acidaminobacteraceae bacterium]
MKNKKRVVKKEAKKDVRKDVKKDFKKDVKNEVKKDVKNEEIKREIRKDAKKDFKKDFRRDVKEEIKKDIKKEAKKVVEEAKKVEIITKSFKDYGFDERILKALDALEYENPLEVQHATIDKIMAKKDLIVKSQTGSGKTAAFAIPLCEQIDEEKDAIQVLVLAPTRELVVQVKEDINSIGRFKGIRTLAIYGKESIVEQRNELKKMPHVVVATPGRMMDHIIRRNVKLKELKFLVVDEADEMFLMGFLEQLESIIAKVPEDIITLLFSATISEKVEYVTKKYMKDPEFIDVESRVSTLQKISQLYYAVDGLSKVDFMKKMLRQEMPRKAIVFCNTRDQVDKLFDILKKWEPLTCSIHGGMEQDVRLDKIQSFKNGEYKVMIATDIAARGIHINKLTHIINYSVPFEHEQYVHRIGRTGRVGKTGIAITIVMPSEMQRFDDLQEFLGYDIPCKGGMVPKTQSRKKAQAEVTNKRQRYKVDSNRRNKVILEIDAGFMNAKIKSGLLLTALRSIPDIANGDIGKIVVKDKSARFEVFDGKEAVVIKALKSKKIKGNIYKTKRVNQM